MPRIARPHLYLDKTRQSWCIRDGVKSIRTGCDAQQRNAAETRLAEYLLAKHKPVPSSAPTIVDVLLAYLDKHPKERLAVKNLTPFWGALAVSDITATNCRAFAGDKVARRRDLEILRAAVRQWHKEINPLAAIPAFVMPKKPQPKTRWLTRTDIAKLLWAARKTPHLARFIVIAFYTGSRSGAILDLQWSWIDWQRGIMSRRAPGTPDTGKKRRPPVRMGRRLTTHLKRWLRIDSPTGKPVSAYVVNYEGRKVRKLRRSWATAARKAGVAASPHDLRRTRATILMSRGAKPWDIAESLGMTREMLETVYAQHDPNWQRTLADIDR